LRVSPKTDVKNLNKTKKPEEEGDHTSGQREKRKQKRKAGFGWERKPVEAN